MKNTLKYFIPDMIEILWMTLLGLSVVLLFLDSHRQSERIKDLEVIVNAQQLLDNLEQPLYAEPK